MYQIQLTSKYFEEIVDSIINNREIESPDTKKELLSLLEDNENVLEKHGIEVSEDQKQKIIDEIVESNITVESSEPVDQETMHMD